MELFHAGLDAIATQADTNVLYAGIFEMGDGTGDVRTSISDGNTQDDVFLLRHQGNSGYPPTPKFVIFNTLPNFSQGAVGFSRFIGYKFVIE